MSTSRPEDRRIDRPPSEPARHLPRGQRKMELVWACALVLGSFGAGTPTAAVTGRQCSFDPALIAAFAQASNQSRREAGMPDWTTADLDRKFAGEWEAYFKLKSREDWAEYLKDRARKEPGGVHWQDAQRQNRLAGLDIDKAVADVYIARARCEGLIAGGPSAAPPASAKRPASAPAQMPAPAAGSVEEQRAALEALRSVLNDTSELEAAKASAERTMAEVSADLDREVEATRDCGWFPEHCEASRPRKDLKPPRLEAVDTLGSRCVTLSLENVRVDDSGDARFDYVLVNRCGTMQIVNAQIARAAHGEASRDLGLVWMGTHPDWAGGEPPGGLGFTPVTSSGWHYLMPPNSTHRGTASGQSGDRIHAWVASCDAYRDGYYQTLLQANVSLSQDDRVACVKNLPGAPR